MARTHRTNDLYMTRGEILAGCIYWPIYLFLLGPGIALTLSVLGIHATNLQQNIAYFIINFVIVAILFRRYLIGSLAQFGRAFWPCLQAVVLGLAFYYLLSWAVSLIFSLLDLSVSVPNNDAVSSLVQQKHGAMMVCTVFLAPLAEEVLNRGLIFGNLARKSRVAAYVLSTAVFCFLHVIAYLGTQSLGATLLTMAAYAPAGIALGWTLEKSGTIWAPIMVHGFINLIATGIMTLL